jgi:hypothetical protein
MRVCVTDMFVTCAKGLQTDRKEYAYGKEMLVRWLTSESSCAVAENADNLTF